MYTISEIAAEAGCDARTARRWANRLGVAVPASAKCPLILVDDAGKAAILAAIQKKPGNPKFVRGNKLGKLGGRPKKNLT